MDHSEIDWVTKGFRD